ncbi:MAG: phospho-N-acetylmuramoyl-pentapeptide-transferase [Bacteroidetes bacterium]|nr:phospho-N-acetylmuramoyl-pentapeptide-transferase [Bacteroidota bacterium]MBP7400093.1 phospho-N-acetylmuramoyl-pentapeptide-transferase [Chitinophagales bacterium]MBK7109176.1 phospho-N-acetylmuramoyl-pentapeptide-transferase [Bacteroidota bacterium]MBP8754234.1 phospho-N-acetylmuramoyl-pentapeptide-transferase [Chitinophagales bacterium]MBP9188694.1 phospho-N-acetylmuramoyl-pentapeptide-transferase [Chitinophagales bacterium]
MLYYLFNWLDQQFNFPGAGLFQYLSFRAAMTIFFSLIISIVFGKRIIIYLQKKQIGESVRDLGLEGQLSKKGTPTMGGIIILLSIIIPTLLFADILNIYILLMLIVTIWLGVIGFLDDYIKVFKKNKEGLRATFKLMGQVVIALIVGLVLFFNDSIKVRDFKNIYVYESVDGEPVGKPIDIYPAGTEKLEGNGIMRTDGKYISHDTPSTHTTIPFIKNNEFDYEWLVAWADTNTQRILFPIVFIAIIIIIITAVSNGANLTDGLDGLAAGTSSIIGLTLLIFSYVAGNVILAQYLNVMYIPNSGELVIFSAAFIGACVGFLWYNTYPAQVFMGDTGSLALGGIIATLAIIVRKELLIPVLCGIFLMENLSVMVQVSYFKYTRKKYGEGRRIFLMAPLHHHFQKKGYHETKIVARFWIIGVLLAIITIVTLKVR